MKCWCWADIVPLQITPQGATGLTFLCVSFHTVYAITFQWNMSKSYLFSELYNHFQLLRDVRGSCEGSAFDCQRPLSSPLPEALTLR